MNGCFIYGSTYEDVYRFERHLVLPRLFATNAYDYIPTNTIFNADEKKAGTARRFCCERLSDTVNAYSFEISAGGYVLSDGKTKVSYTEEGCKLKLTQKKTIFYLYHCRHTFRKKYSTNTSSILQIYKRPSRSHGPRGA